MFTSTQFPCSRCRILWERLIEPTSAIHDEEQRRLSRLLASIMLVLIILLLPVSLIPALVYDTWLPLELRFWGALVADALCVIGYFMARAGHYHNGTRLLVICGSLLVFALAVGVELSKQDGLPLLLYFTFIILYGSFFLQRREIIWEAAFQAALTLSAAVFIPGISLTMLLANAMVFNLLFALLTIVITYHRDWLEVDRGQKLAESEARFRGVFESAAVGVVIIDSTGRIVEANEAMASMLRYPREELFGMMFTALVHDDDLPNELDRVSELLTGTRTAYQIEKRSVRKDKTVFWTRATGSLLHDAEGKMFGGVGVVQDIEEEKQAAAQRLELAVDRERFQLISRLVHTISHDFRTSLAIIETSRYLIQRSLPELEREKLEPKFQTIATHVVHLTEQLDNLRAIALSHQLQRTPCHVDALLAPLVTDFAREVERRQKPFSVQFDPALPVIMADHEALKRAVQHLLVNALNHSPEDAAISLRVVHDADAVLIIVHDTGGSIDPAHLESIFEPFFRADPAMPPDKGGSGLGLRVVKSAAEAHNGSVTVTSTPEAGTTFTLRLPVGSAE